MASNYSTLDPVVMDFPFHWYPPRRAMGLRSSGVGRILGVGPRRKCILDALVSRYSLFALGHDSRKAGYAQDLEPCSCGPYLQLMPFWNHVNSQRISSIRTCVRTNRNFWHSLSGLRDAHRLSIFWLLIAQKLPPKKHTKAGISSFALIGLLA